MLRQDSLVFSQLNLLSEEVELLFTTIKITYGAKHNLVIHYDLPESYSMMIYFELRALLIDLEKTGWCDLYRQVFKANGFFDVIVPTKDMNIGGLIKENLLNLIKVLHWITVIHKGNTCFYWWMMHKNQNIRTCIFQLPFEPVALFGR